MVLRVTTVIALLLLGTFLMPATPANAAPAATDNTVLILESSVTGGVLSKEYIAIDALGFDIELASGAAWLAKTQADFESYRAIVLGDPNCFGPGLAPVQDAIINANVWGAAIDGRVMIVGTDPVFHSAYPSLPGAPVLLQNTIEWALENPAVGKTSALIMLSCYYNGQGAGNVVTLLQGLGNFIVSDARADVAGATCIQECHIPLPAHASMTGLTDAAISNWNCPAHALFTTYPVEYDVVAVANGGPTPGGTPYILALEEGGIVDICDPLSIVVGGVTPDTLWSPNHFMIDIEVDADVYGTGVDVTRTITCSETPKAPWTVFYEDGADIWHFKLRADRNGNDVGRTYFITYTGTDDCGNVVSTTATVVVPHDMRDKKTK